MTFCLFLFYILNNLVTNIVFPGKQGRYLENGIRPLFLFYKKGKYFLRQARREGGGVRWVRPHPPPPPQTAEVHFFVKKINSKKKIIVLFCLFCSNSLIA